MIEERSEETPKGRQVGISLAEFRDYRERKKPSERERGRRGGREEASRRETAGSSSADKSRDLFRGSRRKLIRRSGFSVPPFDSNLQQAFQGFRRGLVESYQPFPLAD